MTVDELIKKLSKLPKSQRKRRVLLETDNEDYPYKDPQSFVPEDMLVNGDDIQLATVIEPSQHQSWEKVFVIK